MELKINIEFDQILELVSQLSPAELEELLAFIQSELKSKKEAPQKTPLQELLLQGPTWTEQEYQDYLEARKYINQFRSAQSNDVQAQSGKKNRQYGFAEGMISYVAPDFDDTPPGFEEYMPTEK